MKTFLLIGICLLMSTPGFSQNVGIGIINPAYSLDVHGSINVDSFYRIGTYPVITTKGDKLFLGINAGRVCTGSSNTFCGYASGFSNSTGTSNSFFGMYAGVYSTGSSNCFFGRNTGSVNNGNDNSFYGMYAGATNAGGNSNSLYGYFAGYKNIGGYENSFFGKEAGYDNTYGNYNSFFGESAGRSNTDGYDNSFFGESAGFTNTNGTRNTAVGYTADVTSGSFTNATAIGHNAKADGSDKVRIGDVFVGSIGGQVGWSTFSDGRFKNNIQENIQGISFIKKLRPVSYQVDMAALNNHYYNGKIEPEVNLSTQQSLNHQSPIPSRQTGFIAQEVERAADELGFSFSGVDKPQNETALYGLRYAEFVVPLVKAVQEQQVMIDQLNLIVEKQQEQIDELKSLVLELVAKK